MFRYWLIGLFLGIWVSKTLPVLAQTNTTNSQPTSVNSVCPAPVLSRLKRHKTIEGETIGSIANQYNLIPQTIIEFNPELKQKPITPGQELLIPPFNGIRVNVPKGATWKDLEGAYGVRADVLFEMNGCVLKPQVVFIPGVNWTNNPQNNKNYTGLRGYPLPFVAEVGLRYGWQEKTTTQEQWFHSGIDLLAPVGTEVLAADSGTVIYVGQEGNYGVLIVIDHGNGRQTRYAHLSKVSVSMEQKVNNGDIIGTVGTTGKPDISASHLHFEVRFKFPVGWVAQDPEININQKVPDSP